jgi:multidrug efflux pump subunit AcrA (membrane-fusion protein)
MPVDIGHPEDRSLRVEPVEQALADVWQPRPALNTHAVLLDALWAAQNLPYPGLRSDPARYLRGPVTDSEFETDNLLAVAEATLRMARDQVERLERLAKVASGALAEEELATRRNEAAVATANVALAKAALEQTEAMLARLTVRSPLDGTVLQVNIRAGEAIVPGAGKVPMLVGNIRELQVRADVDEQVAPRVRAGAAATGYVRGDPKRSIPLSFVRIEPFVIPKVSLTGGSSERVDTRVLQVIYSFANPADRPLYVGQQMDLFIEE